MDEYERICIVGRGAYGSVHLCKRKVDGRKVILKEIPVDQLTREDIETTLNEGKVLSLLHHPNVILYYDSFRTVEAIMIVMEYAPGGTLHDYLQQRSGNLEDEKDILHLFSQILLGLHHIHSNGILHRDLKTQNILLDADKNIVKIGDFGISKILASKSDQALSVIGTPCYLSPEICDGRPYDKKSDIWATGCILYELITLRRAFEAPTLPALVLKIMRGNVTPIDDRYSNSLKRLLMSLLHLDPNRRPSTSEIMDQPILYNAITNLYTDIGKVSCISRSFKPPMSPGMKNSLQFFKEIVQFE